MLRSNTVVDPNGLDLTPRYAPGWVTFATTYTRLPVEQYLFHPAGTAPAGCPIRIDCNVLELRTQQGSRWYGCKRAYINSELRMVVVGFPARFEEMSGWDLVPAGRA